MSKQQPSNPLLDEDLPPPYSPSAAAVASPPAESQGYTTSSLSSQSSLFGAHLSSLHSRIASEQAVRTSTQDQRDSQTLALLVPHVEALLSSIASMHPPPSLVEATLVPGDAVGDGWQLTDADGRQAGEATTIVRVMPDLKMEGDRKRAPPPVQTESPRRSEFDGWGRWDEGDDAAAPDPESALWWSDEAMARRLARHLQPERATASVDRQAVRAQVVQAKEDRKASRWSLFKKDEPRQPASFAAPSAAPSRAGRSEGEDVTMTVAAEEATFRRENDMGIWESKTGWGLVVRVRIRRA